MYKGMALVLATGSGGGGVVCVTLHLTNASGSTELVDPLNIRDKPKIKEEEFVPEVKPTPPPPPPAAPAPAESSPSSEQPEASQTDEKPSERPQSSENQSNTQITYSGALSPVQAIQQCALKINTADWITGGKSYNNLQRTFDILSTMTRCQAAAQSYADEQSGASSNSSPS